MVTYGLAGFSLELSSQQPVSLRAAVQGDSRWPDLVNTLAEEKDVVAFLHDLCVTRPLVLVIFHTDHASICSLFRLTQLPLTCEWDLSEGQASQLSLSERHAKNKRINSLLSESVEKQIVFFCYVFFPSSITRVQIISKRFQFKQYLHEYASKQVAKSVHGVEFPRNFKILHDRCKPSLRFYFNVTSADAKTPENDVL